MTGRAADLALAVEAVRRAAAEVAAGFRVAQAVHYKDPEQPVTAADLAADALLRDALLGARPDYGWLSEESAEQPGRAAHGRTWMVDPIDGTNSFVAGIPEFGISVGLVENGRPVVGVVANPATGEVYTAAEGGGAFLNGAPIRVRAARAETPSLVVSRSEQAKGWFSPFAGWELRPCGSTAIKMCRVAGGLADGFVSFGPKHPWDVCAAELIVREAGGVVTDLAGAPLVLAAGAAWRGLAVAHPSVHPRLLALAGGR